MAITQTEFRLPTSAGTHRGNGGSAVWWNTKGLFTVGGELAFNESGTVVNGLTQWLVAHGFGLAAGTGEIKTIRFVWRIRKTTGEATIAQAILRQKHAYDSMPKNTQKTLSLPLTGAFVDYPLEWPASVFLDPAAPDPKQVWDAVSVPEFGTAIAFRGAGAKIEIDSVQVQLDVESGGVVEPKDPTLSEIADRLTGVDTALLRLRSDVDDTLSRIEAYLESVEKEPETSEEKTEGDAPGA